MNGHGYNYDIYEEFNYSQNSTVQEEVWLMNQTLLEKGIQSLLQEEEPKCINVADLGCGVGKVPLSFVRLMKEIVQNNFKNMKKDIIEVDHHQIPNIEIQIYLNDLPSNDFNLLFGDLRNLEKQNTKEDSSVPLCFLVGAPGSHYHRLFPHNTLHFVHSSYALHWLSQAPSGLLSEEGVPINKKNIYISETSREEVAKAYMKQFEQDFTQFLECRSQELVPKGLMLMTFVGRPSSVDMFTWQTFELTILTKALSTMVLEGLIKEEELDNFNFPVYLASKEQVQSLVFKEGSFVIKEMKTLAHKVVNHIEDTMEKAKFIAKYIGAFSKSTISKHFGEDILNPLYDKLINCAYQHLVDGLPIYNFALTFFLEKKEELHVE